MLHKWKIDQQCVDQIQWGLGIDYCIYQCAGYLLPLQQQFLWKDENGSWIQVGIRVNERTGNGP